MPDYGFDEDTIAPRRPTKADYTYARQFRQPMALACRLWLAGHRRRMTPAQARNARV